MLRDEFAHLQNLARENKPPNNANDAEVESEKAEEALTCKQRVYSLFDSDTPKSPKLQTYANIISILIVVAILVSCVSFTVETLPVFYNSNNTTLYIIEVACIAIFTVEFVIRLITCPNLLSFMKVPFNWVDFLSIAPFYVELVIGLTQSSSDEGEGEGVNMGWSVLFRAIRLTRVFRVFKLSRYSSGLQSVGQAMKSSTDALILLSFLLVIAMILFSTAIYFAELRGSHFDEDKEVWIITETGEESLFQSIPASFWWCIVTVTTVGYGDAVPNTALGKLVGAAAMLTGILVIALPTILIGANFTDIHRAVQAKKARRLRQLKAEEKRKKALAQGNELSNTSNDPSDPSNHVSAEVLQHFINLRLYKLDIDNKLEEVNKLLDDIKLKSTAMERVVHAILEICSDEDLPEGNILETIAAGEG